jgi:DnaJ-class molecular chaperone
LTDAEKRDLYGVLGVARDADEETLRKAYRSLARRHHPDVNPGDEAAEERFKAISEAYAVLSDPEKRRNYDEFGEIALAAGFDAEKARAAREAFGRRFGGGGAGGSPFEGFGERGAGFQYGDLDDLFSDLFARRGWGEGPRERRGADLEAELELDFVDAALGGERRLSFTRPTADGGQRQETVTVRIPPGVAEGGRIRLPGRGGEGRDGGKPGDLYARIRIRPHPYFRREGRDLHLDLPVTLREAVLGAKVPVPTLDGRVTLTIPPGTDSGTVLRLRGKGVPSPAGAAPGDLYATVQIRVPKGLPPEAVAKLEELAKYEPADVRKELS